MLKGTVRWFDEIKGFGFITQENGEDVFVHRSAIAMEGLHLLLEGDKVAFEVVKGSRGFQAANVVPDRWSVIRHGILKSGTGFFRLVFKENFSPRLRENFSPRLDVRGTVDTGYPHERTDFLAVYPGDIILKLDAETKEFTTSVFNPDGCVIDNTYLTEMPDNTYLAEMPEWAFNYLLKMVQGGWRSSHINWIRLLKHAPNATYEALGHQDFEKIRELFG